MFPESANQSPLEPLRPRTESLIEVRQLLAIQTVRLSARHAPRTKLGQFYTHTLGMFRIPEASPELLLFRHARRTVALSAEHEQGWLALAVTQFDLIMMRLANARIPCELSRFDGGLSRMAFMRDPAGNWIRLLETRPF